MRHALIPLVLLTAAACDVPDALLEIPLELESEPYSFDVGQAIADFEAQACTDMTSDECKVIIALDETDDSAVSDPPSIPAVFPKTLDVEQCAGGVGCVTANIDLLEWAKDSGMLDDVKANLTIVAPIDVEEVATEVGVDIDGSNGVEIQSITVAWLSNGLNFATPDIDFYTAPGLLDPATSNGQALISNGTATQVGSLPGIDAGFEGANEVVFAADGETLLADALMGKQFTAIVALPDGLNIALPTQGDNYLKPSGIAEVQAQSVVQFEAGQL